jgi:hypothetical protein
MVLLQLQQQQLLLLLLYWPLLHQHMLQRTCSHHTSAPHGAPACAAAAF